MTSEVTTLAGRLKEETREHHDRAEGHPFQKGLLKGLLPREAFVDSLEQWLAVHRVHEGHLRRHRAVPQIGQVVRDYQFHESRLCDDLTFFGRDPKTVRPLPAVELFATAVRRTADDDPTQLLGFHYVLEGSKNGSKFIARILQRLYGLKPGPGTLYQDPYGEAQREYWLTFRADLDSAEFSSAQQDGIVETAKQMFDAAGELMEQLHSSHQAVYSKQ